MVFLRELQMTSFFNCSRHWQLQINLLCIIPKFLLCFPIQTKFNMAPSHGNKKLVIKILPVHHTSYHVVVCNGVVQFETWSAGVEGPREHQYLGMIASGNVHIPGAPTSPSWASREMHCRKMIWLITFHQQSPGTTIPLLICTPSRFAAKSWKSKRGSSPCFCTTKNLVFRTPIKRSSKAITAYRILGYDGMLAGRPRSAQGWEGEFDPCQCSALKQVKEHFLHSSASREQRFPIPSHSIFSVLSWRWKLKFRAGWGWRSEIWNISVQKTANYRQAVLELSDTMAFHCPLTLWLCHYLFSLSHIKGALTPSAPKKLEAGQILSANENWLEREAVNIHYWRSQERSNCCPGRE